MTRFEFFVPGAPRPKGSMAVIPRRHARPLRVHGELYWRISDLYVGAQRSKRGGQHVDLLAPWVTAVQQEALYHKPLGQGLPGAFDAHFVFHLPRPKKSKHGDIPLGPPDVDKLARGVDDALTGMMWRDDAQVVRLVVEKCWADQEPGCMITVNHHDDQLQLL